MAYSETTQQAEALIAEANSETAQQAEALIAEAKAIAADSRLDRDGRELNERLLALGNALTPVFRRAKSEAEKMFLALGFITGVISDRCELDRNLLALCRTILNNF